MFKSFRVGRVFGIPIELDVTLLLVLPVFAWLIGSEIDQATLLINQILGTEIAAGAVTGGLRPWLVGLAAALGLFVGVALHELGHSIVAMRFGYEIASITLWLLGGVAEPTEQPRNWWHELWIAVAGPVVSVLLGVLGYAALFVIPGTMDVLTFLVAYLAILNVALAAFNLIPAFPLDGGRVLRALLSRSQSFVRATRQAATVGKVFAVLLGLAGLVLLNFFWIAIAFFIYVAAAAESRQTMLDAALEGVRVGDVMTPEREVASVTPDLPIEALLERMFDERHTGYPVVGADGEIAGVVTLDDIRSVSADRRETTPVREVMTPAADLVTVTPEADAIDALQTLAQNGIGRLLVVNDRGGLAGIVTRTDVMTAFQIVDEHRRLTDQVVTIR